MMYDFSKTLKFLHFRSVVHIMYWRHQLHEGQSCFGSKIIEHCCKSCVFSKCQRPLCLRYCNRYRGCLIFVVTNFAYEVSVIAGCCAASLGDWRPNCRGSVVVSSSTDAMFGPLKMKPTCYLSKHPTPITDWRRAHISQEREPRLHRSERLKYESFVCYYGFAIIDRLQTEIIVSKLIKITYIAWGMSLLSSAVIVELLWCSHVSLPIMCLKRFIDAKLMQRRNRSENRTGDRGRRKL